ncbi:uncharacterized protein EI90DRAFT_495 [Cantharellus anzutake]|uniref:uncharacterized protein n=1 Tax=Cantharellus anzutake TaxID=1750568 RepID=UPI0019042631|nr:uncharacterized protein EI90DRAFT_495 [Cantharellus anzutake]KAF8343760.1 hypothetical protein EI90DRAFT_495 [Cantharellus anzutake]
MWCFISVLANLTSMSGHFVHQMFVGIIFPLFPPSTPFLGMDPPHPHEHPPDTRVPQVCWQFACSCKWLFGVWPFEVLETLKNS